MPQTIVYPIEHLANLFIEKGGITVTPQNVQATLAAGSANQLLAAGVASKRIRLFSLVVSSQAAAVTYVTFKDASGGTAVLVVTVPSNASATPNVILDANKYGWADLTTGNGLYCDVGAGAGVYISARVAIFTP